MQHFADRLCVAVQRVGNPVVAGIDPRLDWLPEEFQQGEPADAVGRFCAEVLDVLKGKVPAVKFQMAFFERLGPRGLATLWDLAGRARRQELMVIWDGKRNDVGTTAEGYAQAYLENEACDALTVTPYLGTDGIDPFIKVAAAFGKGIFVLVRTSNPSAREFQDLVCDGKPLYRHVADHLRTWGSASVGECGYGLAGAVVGATYPAELAELRTALPAAIFLVPGYGAQGGTAKDVAAAFDARGLGAIVNNSRGLVYAYREPKYRDRARGDWRRAIELAFDDMAADLAANTPAGSLRVRSPR